MAKGKKGQGFSFSTYFGSIFLVVGGEVGSRGGEVRQGMLNASQSTPSHLGGRPVGVRGVYSTIVSLPSDGSLPELEGRGPGPFGPVIVISYSLVNTLKIAVSGSSFKIQLLVATGFLYWLNVSSAR